MDFQVPSRSECFITTYDVKNKKKDPRKKDQTKDPSLLDLPGTSHL